MRTRTLLQVLGLAAISGCASPPSAVGNDPAAAPLDLSLQSRVAWLEKCPHAKDPTLEASQKAAFLGLIAAAIAPKLIEGAVDSAAAALKAAGQAKTSASTATNLSNFYGVSQKADLKVLNTCMVVVRGKFSSDGTGTAFPWADNDQLRGLDSIQFLLEAKLQPLRGNKYFQLVPEYLAVNGFEDRSFADRKDRDYTVAVTMTVPGGAQPFGSAELTFKDISVGAPIADPNDWRLRGAASLPIAFPPESADVTKAKAKREAQLAPYLLAMDILSPEDDALAPPPSLYDPTGVTTAADELCRAIGTFNQQRPKQFQINDDRCAYKIDSKKAALDAALKQANRSDSRKVWANGICKNPIKDGNRVVACDGPANDDSLVQAKFTYFTTQLTLSETREGSKFAAFLGNALGAAKDDVADVLKDKLLPKNQAQKDADAEADRDARTAVLLADLEVTKAEDGLAAALLVVPAKPADITAARIALLKAKIECNKAYRKADLPVRYPELN